MQIVFGARPTRKFTLLKELIQNPALRPDFSDPGQRSSFLSQPDLLEIKSVFTKCDTEQYISVPLASYQRFKTCPPAMSALVKEVFEWICLLMNDCRLVLIGLNVDWLGNGFLQLLRASCSSHPAIRT